MSLLERTKALLSVSAYGGQSTVQTSPSAAVVEAIRKALGGNLLPPIQSKLEWFLQEADIASHQADLGNMEMAGRLKRAMFRDPVIQGLGATKYGGISRLRKKWYGSQRVIDWLLSKDGGIPRFDLICPPSEIRAIAEDSDTLGFSASELVPVEGRLYPVLERKDPEFAMYRWADNTWHLRSIASLIQMIPGDGQWVFNVQGPRIAPWATARWHSLSRMWIAKDSCQHLQRNYAFKLANAARVAVSPRGAAKQARHDWFRQVAAWGINTVFQVDEGWDVRLIESNGNGTEIYEAIIKECNESFMLNLVGNFTQVTGGSGFSSTDLPQEVRQDLIEECANPIANTISTQVLPPIVYDLFPEEFEDCPGFTYEVEKPANLASLASIYTSLGSGLQQMEGAANKQGYEIELKQLFSKFDVTLRKRGVEVSSSKLTLTPSDVAKVVTVDEARESQGLPPIGDDRGDMTIQELTDANATVPGDTDQSESNVIPLKKDDAA